MRLEAPQRFYSARSFFPAVIVIDVLQAIAFDMYTPALPSMVAYFEVSAARLNQTVFGFLLIASVVMLVAGPVSDRLGRKAVIVAGSVLFTVASFVCMLASNLNVLIVARCAQAVGYGVSGVVVPALLKDAYDEQGFKTSLAILKSMVVIGPVIAPFLGSLMLELTDWRGIFGLLTVFGAVSTVLSLLITETLSPEYRLKGSFAIALRNMGEGAVGLCRSKGFRSLSLFLALGGMPIYAFMSVSSYIVMDEFARGYLEFSLVYGCVCFVDMVAPYVFLFMSRHMGTRVICRFAAMLACVSAVLLVLVGAKSPFWLFVVVAPCAMSEGIIRTAAYAKLLDQHPSLVGLASSVSSFLYGTAASLATVAATLPWPSFLFGLQAIMCLAAVGLVALLAKSGRSW